MPAAWLLRAVLALALLLGVTVGLWVGPLAGIALLVLGVIAVPAVLGIQFAVMREVNARTAGRPHDLPAFPPLHPPSSRDILRAAWRETRAFFRMFTWRQAWRADAVADALPARPEVRQTRGVLLIHGYCCNRGLWQDWQRDLHAQGIPTLAIDLHPVFASIDAYTATLRAAIDRLHDATGRRPVLVAHSMGGLAVRAWLRADAAAAWQRIAHVVTIGTPHHGTLAGALSPTRNARQMRLGSRWLHDLAATEDPACRDRFTCFWSHCDNIVFPAATATLPGARNHHLPGRAHVDMLDDPAVMQAVVALVRTVGD
jgi:triacylglycerol esterase/lipase EstA (alpha/beta hydrolase family)